MSATRNPLKENFTQIPNELVLDKKIPNGAFRVMVYLFSKPSGWVVNNSDIKKQLGIGQNDTIAEYWRRLINEGWITRVRNSSGGFDYDLNIEKKLPVELEEGGVFGKTPNRGNPQYGEMPNHSNTDLGSNTDLEEECPATAEPPAPPGLPQPLKENKPDKKGDERAAAVRIVSYLNEKAGRNFSVGEKISKVYLDVIIARLRDGVTEEQMKMVVDNRCSAWLGDATMSEFLRPNTLFIPKNIANYLESATRSSGGTKNGPVYDIHLSNERTKAYDGFWSKLVADFPKIANSVRFLTASEYTAFYADRPDFCPAIWVKYQKEFRASKMRRALIELEGSSSKSKLAPEGLFDYLKTWFKDEYDGKH